MKQFFRLVILLTLMVSGSVALAQGGPPKSEEAVAPERQVSNWKVFTSRAGGFSIIFPGTPEEKSQTTDAGAVHTLGLRTTFEYSVMFADYPVRIDGPDSALAVLDDGARGAVASLNAQALENKEISLGGHPGRTLKAKLPDGRILRARLYLVGQRFYQVALTTPKEDGASPDDITFFESVASRFLNSFKFETGDPTPTRS